MNVRLQPVVYTTDVDVAVDWYSAVLGRDPSYRSDAWTSFEVDGATLGIHVVDHVPETSRIHVSLIATEPLEAVLARLSSSGVMPAGAIENQPFGRSVLLRDPDGSPVQINEHAAH